jgi:putative transposase
VKAKRHTPTEVVAKLDEGRRLIAGGLTVEEACRQLAITDTTWHRWSAQYGAMKTDDAKRLKQLEVENARLKKLVANKELEIDLLKELAEGKW